MALASACIYFLINSIGQKFAEICLDLEVTTERQFYKPRLILWWNVQPWTKPFPPHEVFVPIRPAVASEQMTESKHRQWLSVRFLLP